MAKNARNSKGARANAKQRREALDSAVTREEWDALFANLAVMATSSDDAVAVRAAELLLRYRSEQAAEPPREQDDQQIKYIVVHSPAPNPSAKT